MDFKKIVFGLFLLTTFVFIGVFFSAQRFNREMGEPAAVVFAWQKEEQDQKIKYRGKVLGYEFIVFRESLDNLKQNFQQSYVYWRKKIGAFEE